MASRDLTQAFIDRRNAAIRKRSKESSSAGTCIKANYSPRNTPVALWDLFIFYLTSRLSPCLFT